MRYRQLARTRPPKDIWDSHRREFVPTDRLLLDSGSYGPVHCEDTESGGRIEDTINDLIVRWVQDAGRRRSHRRWAEAEQQKRAEEEKIRRQQEADLNGRRQELAARQKVEQARVDRLIADAES